jgi:proline iminopeptidase
VSTFRRGRFNPFISPDLQKNYTMNKKLMKLALVAVSALIFTGCDKELNPKDPGNLVPKTVEEDNSLPSIIVNGTKLHAETFGSPLNPMIIFLHGGPGADYRNGLNVKQLANNNYYVVFYDQRGSGLSKRHLKNSYSIQVMLDDLTAVIEHYRTSPAQKVFLFGHSWGAMLATAYINKYPTKINGAVLAEPGGFTWDELKEYSEKSRKLELFSEATNDAIYPGQFFTGNENDHAILDYQLSIQSSFTYAKGNEEGIEGPSPFWRNGAAIINKLFDIGEKDGFNFKSNLNQFTTKVLFLYSENNKAYGEAFARKESSAYPIVQLNKISGTGHEMIYFGWDKVYPLALTYYNSLR